MNIAKVVRRKLRQLEIADRLDDLRVPPGNHLEALKGDRSGQYSIYVNDQWCVCLSLSPSLNPVSYTHLTLPTILLV